MAEELMDASIYHLDELIRLNDSDKELFCVDQNGIKSQEAIEASLGDNINEYELSIAYLESAHENGANLYTQYDEFAYHQQNSLWKNYTEKLPTFGTLMKTRYDLNEDYIATLNSEEGIIRCNATLHTNFQGLNEFERLNVPVEISQSFLTNSTDQIFMHGQNHDVQYNTYDDIRDGEITEEDKSANIEHHLQQSKQSKGSVSYIVCCTCGQDFSHKRNLDRHIQEIHEMPKLYKSTECDRPFTRKERLEPQYSEHQSGIISQKLFKCSICNLVFKRSTNLKLHEYDVHGKGDRLRCSYCKKKRSFSQEKNLLAHLRKYHGQ